MAMSNLIQRLLLLIQGRSEELDRVLDHWIQDALIEEAVAQPPSGTWDRLRMVLERRRTRRHGMWVLDEPLRDPPESLAMLLSCSQFQRAHRLYVDSRYAPAWNIKDSVFNHPLPTFSALVHY